MTFYCNTKIEYWQSREQSALRLAFQESPRRHTVSKGDRELVRGRFRHDLLAVNSFSRRIWGEAISNQVSGFFCDDGDGTTHNQEVFFVSLVDVTCARSPEDQLTEADLELVKNRSVRQRFSFRWSNLPIPSPCRGGFGMAGNGACSGTCRPWCGVSRARN
jgi:hypothetical protein